MIAFVLLLIGEPDATLHALFPCTAGLSITYTIEPKAAGAKASETTETVLGPGKEPHTCLIERRTATSKDTLLREHLDDRILNAGYADQPVALRAPLMKAPVEKGRSWHFTTTDFEIADAGDTYDVPAGTFDHCVRVHERAQDGKHEADSVYAPGVGLIAYESRDLRMRATRIEKASVPPVKTDPTRKNSKRTSR